MTRWIVLAITMGALVLTVFGPTPGWMLLGFVLAVLGSLACAFAFAHARIQAGARSEELEMYKLSAGYRQSADANDNSSNAC